MSPSAVFGVASLARATVSLLTLPLEAFALAAVLPEVLPADELLLAAEFAASVVAELDVLDEVPPFTS